MPLLDHFHPPLSASRHWEAFHARWAAALADELNAQLPEGYFAEAQVHHGARVEIDVATFSEINRGNPTLSAPGTQTVAEPLTAADLVIPAVFPGTYAVHVFQTAGGPSLVAAIELVSPGNKDRAEHRRAFAIKCAAYLQQGMGLIVVDVVTNRRASPLRDLLELLDRTDAIPVDEGALGAVAYRPLQHEEQAQIELRIRPVAVDQVLPTLPLALDAGQVLAVDFEAAYEEARQRSRM